MDPKASRERTDYDIRSARSLESKKDFVGTEKLYTKELNSFLEKKSNTFLCACDLYMYLAKSLIKQEKYTEALSVLNKAYAMSKLVQKEWVHMEICYTLANCYYSLKSHDSTMRWARKSLKYQEKLQRNNFYFRMSCLEIISRTFYRCGMLVDAREHSIKTLEVIGQFRDPDLKKRCEENEKKFFEQVEQLMKSGDCDKAMQSEELGF